MTLDRHKIYYDAHRDEIAAQRAKKYREDVAADPLFNRRKRLWQRYKMTLEDFDALLAEQNGRCAICGTTEPGDQHGWHVDHDHRCCPKTHTCGKCIRAVLCGRCNRGLGLFLDDPGSLLAAAVYLNPGSLAEINFPPGVAA